MPVRLRTDWADQADDDASWSTPKAKHISRRTEVVTTETQTPATPNRFEVLTPSPTEETPVAPLKTPRRPVATRAAPGPT